MKFIGLGIIYLGEYIKIIFMRKIVVFMGNVYKVYNGLLYEFFVI